jgi:hypothetical protein
MHKTFSSSTTIFFPFLLFDIVVLLPYVYNVKGSFTKVDDIITFYTCHQKIW